MSGEPSWARTDPSTYSTRLWTTDCGWMTMSNARPAAGRDGRPRSARAPCSSGRRIDRDLGAHRPIGMGDRLARGGGAHLVEALVAERSAAGGEDDPPHAVGTGAVEALEDGIMLGIDRQQLGPARSAPPRSSDAPAETSASLLAERRCGRRGAPPWSAQGRRSRRSPPSSSRRPPPRLRDRLLPGRASVPVPASAVRRASRGLVGDDRPAGADAPGGVGEAGDVAMGGDREDVVALRSRSIRSRVERPTEPVAPRMVTLRRPVTRGWRSGRGGWRGRRAAGRRAGRARRHGRAAKRRCP
jgi:hypothetical protein